MFISSPFMAFATVLSTGFIGFLFALLAGAFLQKNSPHREA
jgi:hypothetical protein